MAANSATALDGRIALVTGATSGIGQETAVGLAARGAQVVLVGRDRARAEDARKDVTERSSNPHVDVLLADFASLDAVRGLAREFCDRYPALHLLVNNAGLVMTERVLTVDGYETTLAVNHLAPFLLTHLLRERLLASGPARIVNVASDAHRFVPRGFDFDDPMAERSFGFPTVVSGLRIYGMSKLANILFTVELARRLEGTRVTANAVHPGGVATRLGTNTGGVLGKLIPLAMRPFFKTPEQGAATSLYVATSPAVADTNGRYFADSREREPSRAARDGEAARRLWNLSCEWVGVAVEDTRWST
ncbi:MAG: SDR family oxidoreductase [Deltaproteobacteria bacterium]|nr:MAG: SDR family oxidoreductase [Deltaproteobacteria bacterium]